MQNPIASRLYLRIWLAVAGSVLVLSLVLAWAWHQAESERERERQAPPPRDVVLRNAQGTPVAHGEGVMRWSPGQGTELTITLDDGRVYDLDVGPSIRHPKQQRARNRLRWLRPPYGFIWIVGLAGLAVMVGVFPVARRLTQRLEALQRGVRHWGDGHLDTRVPEAGHDEVADLSRHFNLAAERIEELMRHQEALVQSQKSLLANASHELRSPLARIRMALELMAPPDALVAPGSPLAAAASRGSGQAIRTHAMAFDEVRRNISELDQLIDEILLASRLDAPDVDLGTLEDVDLIGLVAEEAIRMGASVEVAADTSEILVSGVNKLLRRAVRNLLENAARHGKGGDVNAHLEIIDACALLHVDDHGPGIPESQRARIFEPFYRVAGASERDGGVGLGLALVRSIAEHHRGSVCCSTAPGGQGARFTMQLPLGHATTEPTKAS